MKFTSDIDIDLADRNKLIELINVVPASIRKDNLVKKHNTGVYPTTVPFDPTTGTCSIDYNSAEERGYVKLDLLNVWVYKLVDSESHLLNLMRAPNWSNLHNKQFFEKLIHIGKHYDVMKNLPEPIDSIPRMAMFLAIIRPGKKHLIGLPWKEVAKTVWDKGTDGYTFKKSHSLAYAHLVVVHINLLSEWYEKTKTYDFEQLSP